MSTMSTMSTSQSCVVCGSPELTTVLERNLLEHQLRVIFFLDKLFALSMSTSTQRQSGRQRHDDNFEGQLVKPIDLEELLLTQGHPSEWIQFCLKCHEGVEEGRKLFIQMSKCRQKLDQVRKEMAKKVRQSWSNNKSNNRKFSKIDEIVRKYIVCQDDEGEIPDVEVIVKEEIPDLSYEGGNRDEDFEPTGFLAHDEEIRRGSFEDFVVRPDADEDSNDSWKNDGIGNSSDEDNLVGNEVRSSNSAYQRVGRPKKGNEKRSRVCPECGRICRNPSAMIRHWNTKHIGKGPFTCPACNLVVKTKEDFFKHKKSHNDPSLLQPTSVGFKVKVSTSCSKQQQYDNNLNVKNEDLDGNDSRVPKIAKICDNGAIDMKESKEVQQVTYPTINQRLRAGKKKSPVQSRTCPVCSEVFDKPSRMKYHVQIRHPEVTGASYTCGVCERKFPHRSYLESHQWVHLSKEERSKRWAAKRAKRQKNGYNDDLMNEKVNLSKGGKKSELKKEKGLSRASGKKKSSIECRTCPVCSEVFERPSRMKYHLEIRHPEVSGSSYTCEVCGRNFPTRSYLESHQWIHLSKEERLKRCAAKRIKRQRSGYNEDSTASPLEKRTCPVCSEVLPTPSRMRIHKNVYHDKKRDFVCEKCGKGFLRSDTLKKHLETHLSPEERELLYSGSTDITVNPSGLYADLKTQNQINGRKSSTADRACRVCKKIFHTPYKTQRHLLSVHGEGGKHICEVCGKVYGWKDTLKKHMRYHDDEEFMSGAKNFTCSVCNIQFRHKYSYDRHKLYKHTDPSALEVELPFTCDLCGKKFKLRNLFELHVLNKHHSGMADNTLGQKPQKAKTSSTVRFRSNVDLRDVVNFNQKASKRFDSDDSDY